jgi:hypothetical protein
LSAKINAYSWRWLFFDQRLGRTSGAANYAAAAAGPTTCEQSSDATDLDRWLAR